MMKDIKNDLQETISVGCTVKLFCSTVNEYATYRIVKNKDSVEYKPQFGTKMSFGSKLYYDTVTKFAEYSDDELVEDCPLAKMLMGKKIGVCFKVNDYEYSVEKIIFPDGRTVEVKNEPVVNTPTLVAKSVHSGIDWKKGFANECTKDELQIIRDFETFMAEEFPKFVGVSKINRITFFNPEIQLNGVQYSQFWFIKRGGVLSFRFKLDQNENDEYKYEDNILVADRVQFNSIKILVRLILSAK